MSSKKKIITLTGTALLLSASAYAANVGVDLNLHLGDRPRQTVVREVAPPPREIVIEEDDVDFIYPERLGFYVAVGVPYDLVLIRNNYYLFRDGSWYRARHHRGPWRMVERGTLPSGLRRYKVDRIRHYRDSEYDVYRRDHDRYRGKHFRSGKEEWKEHRKEEKARWKEERREEKEERKRGHGGGRHERD